MILRIAAAFALIAAAIFLYFAGSKNYFEIERSKTVLFTSDLVFDQINNLNHWKKWSAYLKDPNTKIEIVDNFVGKGSSLNWDGADSVGKLEIVDSIKNQNVTVEFNFTKPFKQKWICHYQIKPLDENRSELKIISRGPMNLTTKIMHRLLNIPKLLSEQLSQEIDEIQNQIKNK